MGGFAGTLGAAPADSAPPHPHALSSPADAPHIVPLREKAIAGTILDVQNYLRAELDEAFPDQQGTLVFLPYHPGGSYAITRDEFADDVVTQFHRSAQGRAIMARPGADGVVLDTALRGHAEDIYRSGVIGRDFSAARGYWDRLSIPLQGTGGADIYNFSVIGLLDNCQSCQQLRPPRANRCLQTSPDEVLEEQTDRINVAFHEGAHHTSVGRKTGVVAMSDASQRHLAEINADLTGTLMEARIFGPRRIGKMKVLADSRARGRGASLYFDPPAFTATANWLERNGGEPLQKMKVADIFAQATALADGALVSPTDISNIYSHIFVYEQETDRDSAARKAQIRRQREARMAAYQKQVAAGRVVDFISVNGNRSSYSEVTYQLDLAMQRNARPEGNPHANALAQLNPLRDPALKGQPMGKFDRSSPQQVAAINAFNRAYYGERACTIRVEPRGAGLR